jgi:glyoxylase-like metal-dependent hydrolase (beta-lactamase superfamily II)
MVEHIDHTTMPAARGRTAMSSRPPSATRRIPRAATEAVAHPIIDGLWTLQLPLCYMSVSSVNAYLLEASDGWIVVDCGSCLEPGWDAMALALEQAGAAPQDVALLVVTHSHCDHRGLAQAVVHHTGCGLAMGEGPHPVIDVLRDPLIPLDARRARGRREGVPSFALDALVDELPGSDAAYPHVEPGVVWEPGAHLQTRSGVWEVISTPGHSADQIGLWNPSQRLLLSADLAFPGVASFLEYGTRPDPHADQVASLERAIELQPERLLAGHGRPVADAVSCLEGCRQQVLDRVPSVEATLGTVALSGWDIAALMTPAGALADGYQRGLAVSLCVLEHLEARGRARSVIDDDGTRRWLAAGA